MIGIPSFAFTLIESTIPFADRGPGKVTHRYDYSMDPETKPRLS